MSHMGISVNTGKLRFATDYPRFGLLQLRMMEAWYSCKYTNGTKWAKRKDRIL
jgi:hypothetical protein